MASPTSEVAEPIAMMMDVNTCKKEPGHFAQLAFLVAVCSQADACTISLLHTMTGCELFLFLFAEAETKADSADLDDWEAMASDEERGKTSDNLIHFHGAFTRAAFRPFESVICFAFCADQNNR